MGICFSAPEQAMGQSSSKGGYGSVEPAAPATVGRTRTFTRILDQYESLEEVQEGLRHSGLESSQLIVGIDFTKSNEWTGRNTFGGQCLHDINGQIPPPYEQALSIIAKTLAAFDDDNKIPCYGFGDITTKMADVFSFFPDDRPANGLEGAVARYRQIAPFVNLSGPTSFAPLVRQAMKAVVDDNMQYHILVIIADGQVTPNCLEDTANAIIAASYLPLSIIMVGVGDGPWDQMEEFDDQLKERRFDNFQFVDFAKTMLQASVYEGNARKQEAHFAVHALMEIPEQYNTIQRLGLMSARNVPERICSSVRYLKPKGPPPSVLQADANVMNMGPNAPNLFA